MKRVGSLTYHWKEIAFKYFRRTKSWKSFCHQNRLPKDLKFSSAYFPMLSLPTCRHKWVCVCLCYILWSSNSLKTVEFELLTISDSPCLPWVWFAEICESFSIISLLWYRRERQLCAWEKWSVSHCLVGESWEWKQRGDPSLFLRVTKAPQLHTGQTNTLQCRRLCWRTTSTSCISVGKHTLQHFQESRQTEHSKVVQFCNCSWACSVFPGHG